MSTFSSTPALTLSLLRIEGVEAGLAVGAHNCGIAMDIAEGFKKWSEICGTVSGEVLHMKHSIPAAE